MSQKPKQRSYNHTNQHCWFATHLLNLLPTLHLHLPQMVSAPILNTTTLERDELAVNHIPKTQGFEQQFILFFKGLGKDLIVWMLLGSSQKDDRKHRERGALRMQGQMRAKFVTASALDAHNRGPTIHYSRPSSAILHRAWQGMGNSELALLFSVTLSQGVRQHRWFDYQKRLRFSLVLHIESLRSSNSRISTKKIVRHWHCGRMIMNGFQRRDVVRS